MNSAQVLDEARARGVIFITHEDAARRHVTNLAAWGRLFGYDQKQYVMTIRPYIIHPAGWDPAAEWKHVAHELVHWKRQPANCIKRTWWIVRYGLSEKFRATEEMHAHLVDLRTGRSPPDVPALVERMRDWYRLGGVDPQWMVSWMVQRAPELGAHR